MTTLFFGERWDAPRVDHATQTETPTALRLPPVGARTVPQPVPTHIDLVA